MKDWNEDDTNYLKESYISNIPIEDICKKLIRSYDSVMKKAQRMFLKRNKELKMRHKKLPPLIDLSNLKECSFYIKKHKSLMKDKLYLTLNGDNKK